MPQFGLNDQDYVTNLANKFFNMVLATTVARGFCLIYMVGFNCIQYPLPAVFQVEELAPGETYMLPQIMLLQQVYNRLCRSFLYLNF
jgi:hypothetical protein